MKNNIKKKIKGNEGFTLVEALIAIIILAIVSVVMVQGVSMARRAYSVNKVKTEASALANQEIEKIRAMTFTDIGIISGDPDGIIESQDEINGYSVTRSISWVDGSDNRIKQVKITVSSVLLANSVKIVTEITPFEMSIAEETTTTTVPATTTTVPATTTTVPATTTTVPATTTTVPATTTTTVNYPAPYGLKVDSDKMNNNWRTVKLHWHRPSNPPYNIDRYNIYRNDVVIGTASSSDQSIQYTDTDFEKKDKSSYKYYVTAVYSTGVESAKSNEVTTRP